MENLTFPITQAPSPPTHSPPALFLTEWLHCNLTVLICRLSPHRASPLAVGQLAKLLPSGVARTLACSEQTHTPTHRHTHSLYLSRSHGLMRHVGPVANGNRPAAKAGQGERERSAGRAGGCHSKGCTKCTTGRQMNIKHTSTHTH